ncbi:MAG: hypothetical protein ACP5N3_00660 [Candidatus Nanoarchaeia archaeon]
MKKGINFIAAAAFAAITFANYMSAAAQDLVVKDTTDIKKNKRTTALTVSSGPAFMFLDRKPNTHESNYGMTTGIVAGAGLEQEVLTDGLYVRGGFMIGKNEFDNTYSGLRTNSWFNTEYIGASWSPLSLVNSSSTLPIDVRVGAKINALHYESQSIDLATGKKVAQEKDANKPFDRKIAAVYSIDGELLLPINNSWTLGLQAEKFFVQDGMLDARDAKENDNLYTLNALVKYNFVKNEESPRSLLQNPSAKVAVGPVFMWTDFGNKGKIAWPDNGFGLNYEVELSTQIIDGVYFNVNAQASNFSGKNNERNITYDNWSRTINFTVSMDPIKAVNPDAKASFSLEFGPGVNYFESSWTQNDVKMGHYGTSRNGPLGNQPEGVFYAGVEGNIVVWTNPKDGSKVEIVPNIFTYINGQDVDRRDAAELGERQDVLGGANIGARYTINNERTRKKQKLPEEEQKTDYQILLEQKQADTAKDTTNTVYQIENPWVTSDTVTTTTQGGLEEITAATPDTNRAAAADTNYFQTTPSVSGLGGFEYQIEQGDVLQRLVRDIYGFKFEQDIAEAANIIAAENAVNRNMPELLEDNIYVANGKVIYKPNVDKQIGDNLRTGKIIFFPMLEDLQSAMNNYK